MNGTSTAPSPDPGAGRQPRPSAAAKAAGRFRDVSPPLPCPALFHGLLEDLMEFAQHLPSAVGGVVLAQLRARGLPAHLLEPIPEQLRPASRMPGKFLEVGVEEPKGRDGLALATEQVPMHEVMMLGAWEDTQLNLG